MNLAFDGLVLLRSDDDWKQFLCSNFDGKPIDVTVNYPRPVSYPCCARYLAAPVERDRVYLHVKYEPVVIADDGAQRSIAPDDNTIMQSLAAFTTAQMKSGNCANPAEAAVEMMDYLLAHRYPAWVS